jgi:hypothetical protein
MSSTSESPKRVILNVADGRYTQYQDRLLGSLNAVKNDVPLLLWRDQFPPGSPPHQIHPYVFKLFAIREAIKAGYTSILWVDSGVWFIQHPHLLFERIEAEGHLFYIDADRLGSWSSDAAIEVFGMTRDQIFEKDMRLLSGTMYGFDTANPKTAEFLRQWWRHWEIGTFAGHYLNEAVAADVQGVRRHNKTVGFVSDDPRCQGHRMDETVASFLAYQMDMKLTWLGDMFQGYKVVDEPTATARSGY